MASVGLVSAAHADDTVTIPDPALRGCVEDALNLAPDAPVLRTDAESLSQLTCDAPPRGNASAIVSDLSGLAAFTNLTYLSLQNHRAGVTAVEEISGLTALTDLRLHGNRITDLTPLSAMGSLEILTLFGNFGLSDLAPLTQLTSLRSLSAYNTSLTDPSPLGSLANLEQLSIGNNDLSGANLGFLANLESLRELDLREARISDIGVVAGLENLVRLDIQGNRIADLSPVAGFELDRFFAEGQAIDLGTVTVGEPIDNPVTGPDGAPVELDDLYDPATHTLTVQDEGAGTVSWEITDVLGARLSSSDTFSGTLSFTAVPAVAPTPIDIPDAVLRACINDALGQAPNAGITKTQAASIDRLDCIGNPGSQITDLTGIDQLENLEELLLPRNRVEDLTPLSSLTNLATLRLSANELTDNHLASLADVVFSTHHSQRMLDLSDNDITDMSPLTQLTELTILNVNNNEIADLPEDTADMPLLRFFASGNDISDLTPLAGSGTEWLHLTANRIADISPLAGLRLESFRVDDQLVDLGEIYVGVPVGNPIIGADGTAVELDDLYVAGTNTLTAQVPGSGSVGWEVTDVFGAAVSDIFSGTVSFTASEPGPIDIPDDALRACVNDELGNAPDADVIAAQAMGIVSLQCPAMGIVDLTGLAHFTGLAELSLPDNEIVDLTPMAGLQGISDIDLSGNRIEDVTSMADIEVSGALDLSRNHITDVRPLANLAEHARVEATDQVVHLGEVPVGQGRPNPVIGFTGEPLGLSDSYDPSANTFTATTPGQQSLTWSWAASDATFSGTLQFAATVVTEDDDDDAESGQDQDPEQDQDQQQEEEQGQDQGQDQDAGAASTTGAASEDDPGAARLPSTGAPMALVGLLASLVLVTAGAVGVTRRRS